ncbi:MAG: hypothetical protein BWY09_02787 [Candidatus Hydrogenedentes bacterium ADurb.Bin179]|nr:MAG: hypothetical protein BWY09_02787 [Candidatus Hydrogenedentes bacterium ADurb.Bin179]
MGAQYHGVHVGHADTELHGDKRAHSSAVQAACHAKHTVVRKAQGLIGEIDHYIERVGHNNDDGIRCVSLDLSTNAGDDTAVFLKQVQTRHAGFTRQASRDNHQVRSGDIGIVVGARTRHAVVAYRAGFRHVQGFALGKAFYNVHQDDIAQSRFQAILGGGGPHVSGADTRYFRH